MYVYKITNKLNNKSYIGITVDYKKRWGNECYLPSDPSCRQVIQYAIVNHGKENFDFQILYHGLSIKEAVEKEKELIKEYNCLVPNGYNVDPGGHYFPVIDRDGRGEKNTNSILTDAEAQYILDNRDQPEYVLYEEFNTKISYSEFKAIYNHHRFQHLTTSTPKYKYNLQFSCQFTASPLDYVDIVELRNRYKNGEYWFDVYQEYKEFYPDKWTFWNIYYGNRFKLVMPEVFTQENRKLHSSISKLGSKNGRAKINERDVIKMREMYNNGATVKEIHEQYSFLSIVSIRDIVNFKTWTHI